MRGPRSLLPALLGAYPLTRSPLRGARPLPNGERGHVESVAAGNPSPQRGEVESDAAAAEPGEGARGIGEPYRFAGREGPPPALSTALAGLLSDGETAILVTVAEAWGSTPREAGATMLVTHGESLGTIGGGGLEFHAIDVARVMLAGGERERGLDMPLGPLLGQCCGGRVRLELRAADDAEVPRLAAAEARERQDAPAVLIFGCGHTGRALARALAPLPFRTTLVDDRLDPVDDLPEVVGFSRLDDPAEGVATAGAGAAYVIATHSHALDYRLAEAALRRGDAAYVGMIGSATKRARFEAAFRRSGGSAEALARLTCPIGGAEVADKRPEVIAALTAAELLRVFAARAVGGVERPAGATTKAAA